MNVKNLDINQEKYSFDKLGFVDKMMMIKLLKFSSEITDTVNKFDLREVYEKSMDFLNEEVIDFYLEFSRHKKYLELP